MQYTPAVEEFLTCLGRSGLIDDEPDALVADLVRAGVDISDPRNIALALVRNQTLTSWQADNLLKGKRRGFVLGKYRLLSLLGRGGSGTVFVAEHSLMRRRCAIKVLPGKNLGAAALERFRQEARAVAVLDHSNIVRAYDIGQDQDGKTVIHYFVMELVDGENLHDRVVREGPLPAIDAVNLIRQAADGLAHAHAAGIVHRDVKPANLLMDRQGVVKILDLGLAKMATGQGSNDSALFGTADYLSPEQALDVRSADARSDVYSLGCTFYFLLAGEAPFPDGTLAQRLVRHQFEQPPSLADRRPDVPTDLTALLDRMLIKNPAERIQSCGEVSALMRNWLMKHADRQWLRDHPAVLVGAKDGPPSEARPDLAFAGPDPTTAPGDQFAPQIEGNQPAGTGDGTGFLDHDEFRMPISSSTRLLMQTDKKPGPWDWLARASKRLRGR